MLVNTSLFRKVLWGKELHYQMDLKEFLVGSRISKTLANTVLYSNTSLLILALMQRSLPSCKYDFFQNAYTFDGR